MIKNYPTRKAVSRMLLMMKKRERLSDEVLASRIGVCRGSIQNYYDGRAPIRLETAINIFDKYFSYDEFREMLREIENGDN